MNLPNKLTLMRIILTPIFMAVLYWGFPGADYAALGIFIIASLTDLLDGKIARKYNLVTDFGKFADPLADKILVTAATMVCVIVMLAIGPMVEEALMAMYVSSSYPQSRLPILLVDPVCVWVIVLTTLYSGVEYFVKNRDVIASA